MGMMHVVEHTLSPRTTGVAYNYTRVVRPPAGRMAPGLNGSVFGGASHSWPFRGLGADNVHSSSNKGIFPNGGVGLVLGLALGAAAGGLLLVMSVFAVLLKKWYGTRPKGGLDFDMDDRMTINSSRSAPNTRSNSPDSFRRSKTDLMRSVTMDMISIETEMTSVEAVQPESSDDSLSYTGSVSTLHSQHLVGPSHHTERFNQGYEHDEPEVDDPLCRQGAGRLAYQLEYSPTQEELTINVIKAKHLIGRPPNNSPRDPFVKVSLLPYGKNSHKTRVVQRTLEPVFNDSLTFRVGRYEIEDCYLKLSVYDIDRRRVRHTLGHAFVQLSNEVISLGEVCWAELRPAARTQVRRDLGQMQVTLTLLSDEEQLQLMVSNLSGLNRLQLGRNEGMLASATLFHASRPLMCRKTAMVYDVGYQGQPTLAEVLTFQVPVRQLEACRIEVKLEIVSAVPGNTLPPVEYGHVGVGSHHCSQGAGVNHWSVMAREAGRAVTFWHRIEPPHIDTSPLN